MNISFSNFDNNFNFIGTNGDSIICLDISRFDSDWHVMDWNKGDFDLLSRVDFLNFAADMLNQNQIYELIVKDNDNYRDFRLFEMREYYQDIRKFKVNISNRIIVNDE